ncbi:MAG: LPS-assembly protein LptD [Hyphomicrobiaceae bacterium]|nr:LPS-assembly protein LptD [Hyphomicrobiaceae bacterium]
MRYVRHIIRSAIRAIFPARLTHVWDGASALPLAMRLVLAFIASFTFAAVPPGARAQSPIDAAQQLDSTLPMLLQADQMIYDNQNNRVIAQGNVEIYYNNYTLIADKVIYERGNNILRAEGNVQIKEPTGALIKSNRFTLTDDFRDGFIQSLKIVTEQDARIAAASATRQKGDVTVFNNAVFTPCKPCEDNPEKAPTWQIKSKKIIHKKSEATIEYEDATFEMWGIPIMKMPYFKHADPSVKRKSGFLIPRFGNSDDLGFVAETPYYFALAPNYDFTFSPTYTSKQGVLFKGNWRHRTRNGKYDINLYGIDQEDPNQNFTTSDRSFRGSIDTRGDFRINEYWSWGWDVTAETDDTFRRFYDIDNILATDRISQGYLVGQRDRNYFDARIYHFGGLTFSDTTNSEPIVHPVIDYNYIFSDPVLGGELSFDSNVLSLTRDDNGTDSSRLITQVKWRKQIIDRRGQVITPFASARGDVYDNSAFVDPVTGRAESGGTTLRGTAYAGAEYRFPLVKHTRNAAHIVEPIAQIIARPTTTDQFDVPNEDARSLVFDDTLLFDIDKFSGYDRIESGTRANLGVRYTLQRNNGGYAQAVFGQSYQIAGRNDFTADSGLGTDTSDYVAGLYIQPLSYFGFVAQARLDEDNLTVRRTDLASWVSYGATTASVVYANLDAQPALGIPTDREEIQGSGSLRLVKNWYLVGQMRYDIEGSQRISDSLGLKYADDCFALTVTYEETFIRDRDIEPNQAVFVKFEFKHLGAFDLRTGVDSAL